MVLSANCIVAPETLHWAVPRSFPRPRRNLRYYLFEKAQSKRPVGTTYPNFPPRQGPPPHDLSVRREGQRG